MYSGGKQRLLAYLTMNKVQVPFLQEGFSVILTKSQGNLDETEKVCVMANTDPNGKVCTL